MHPLAEKLRETLALPDIDLLARVEQFAEKSEAAEYYEISVMWMAVVGLIYQELERREDDASGTTPPDPMKAVLRVPEDMERASKWVAEVLEISTTEVISAWMNGKTRRMMDTGEIEKFTEWVKQRSQRRRQRRR